MKLEIEMNEAINCLVNNLKLSDPSITKQLVMQVVSEPELGSLLYGWLSAKGLWDNDIDTTSFIKKLKSDSN